MTKPCPFCKELINEDAIKCKFCGEILDLQSYSKEHSHKNENFINKNIHTATSSQNYTAAIIFAVLSIFFSLISDYTEDNAPISFLSYFFDTLVMFSLRKYLLQYNNEKLNTWMNWIIALEITIAAGDLGSSSLSAISDEGATLVFFILMLAVLLFLIFASIKTGLYMQKTNNDEVGLLKKLGMSYSYLLPITIILLIVSEITENKGLKFIGVTLAEIPTVILIMIFSKAKKVRFIKQYIADNKKTDPTPYPKITSTQAESKTPKILGVSIVTIIIVAKIFSLIIKYSGSNHISASPEQHKEPTIENPSANINRDVVNQIADDKVSEQSFIPDNFIGEWKGSCESASGTIEIEKDQSIHITVNDNQIYIDALSKECKDSSETILLYFEKTTDLGRGGLSLPWKDYSKTAPIGALQFLDKNTVRLNWLGFFNEQTGQREWVDKADWSSSEFDGAFKKCDDHL